MTQSEQDSENANSLLEITQRRQHQVWQRNYPTVAPEDFSLSLQFMKVGASELTELPMTSIVDRENT